jgi:hypothetical protein
MRAISQVIPAYSAIPGKYNNQLIISVAVELTSAAKEAVLGLSRIPAKAGPHEHPLN